MSACLNACFTKCLVVPMSEGQNVCLSLNVCLSQCLNVSMSVCLNVCLWIDLSNWQKKIWPLVQILKFSESTFKMSSFFSLLFNRNPSYSFKILQFSKSDHHGWRTRNYYIHPASLIPLILFS